MTVNVDRRGELFGILFRIAGAEEYRMAPATRYTREVDAHFERFKDHPAVKATQAIRESNGIAFDAPQNLWVYLDDYLMPRRKLSPLPPEMDNRWDGVAIDDYLAKVRGFARVSGADAFFAAHETYYRAVADRFLRPIEQGNVVAWFDRFFGERSGATYTVVPGLLNGGANYGPHAVFEDGRLEMYQVVSLEELDADELPRPSEATIELLVHELAHSYVNPFLNPHFDALAPHLKFILKLVEKPMQRQAYSTARTLGNESLVRAVTALYLKDTKGPDRAEAFVLEEAYRSFFWVHDLSMLLEQYRQTRGRRPDLEVFFPRIAAFFEGVARDYRAHGLPRLPFRGPINNVMNDDDIVLVGPKAGSNTKALGRYIAELQKTAFPSAKIREATASMWAELTGHEVVLYGSPTSNLLVDDLLKRNGWRVSPEEIFVADKHFVGPSLILIACRPNPGDGYRGVLLYTAARDEDLVGVNGVFHGPTDWVVARRRIDGKFETIAKGSFPAGPDHERAAGPR
jgi:hypothetical protein